MSLALQLRQQNSLIPFQLEDNRFCFLKPEGTNALLPLFHQIGHSRIFIEVILDSGIEPPSATPIDSHVSVHKKET